MHTIMSQNESTCINDIDITEVSDIMAAIKVMTIDSSECLFSGTLHDNRHSVSLGYLER